MFLMESPSFHFAALTRLVSLASFLRSWASCSVKMPFCKSLLMSASADCEWARTAKRSEARTAPTVILQAILVFIGLGIWVAWHGYNLDPAGYGAASAVLQLGDDTARGSYNAPTDVGASALKAKGSQTPPRDGALGAGLTSAATANGTRPG